VSGTKPSGRFSEELFEADEPGLKPKYIFWHFNAGLKARSSTAQETLSRLPKAVL
jgi:hypothetical protein